MKTETKHELKTVAIIQARMGSTRLPGKVLEQVAGKPLLAWQLAQLARAKSLDSVLVATTGSPKDDPIVEFCREHAVPCYRGSERDVLDRYYRAAQFAGAEVVVRITADCPLIDPAVVDQVVEAFHDSPEAYDYVANTAPSPGTFPDGMDVEVIRFSALDRAWGESFAADQREHVTFPFWKDAGPYRAHRVEAPEDWSDVRITVDDPGDLALVRKIIEHHGEQIPPVADLVNFVRAEFEDAARGHQQGEGWKAPAKVTDPVPALELTRSDELWAAAQSLIPGGAQTFSKMPAQYVTGVAPKVLVRGKGSKVWDADGNEYIDYVLGLGPAVLGHSRHEINEAVFRCAEDSFCAPSLPHPLETALAQKICHLIPCAQKVRYGKNGSDATAGAVRIARGVTGRDVIACCGYHGWQDWYIGSTTRNCGVPEAVSELTKPFKYGDLDSLRAIFAANPEQVACVILEPVSLEPPPEGYLASVRELCTKHGSLLIFDEIITGFRLHMGGAQTLYGVTPDLATFGKAIANGWPLSVLCGKAEYMDVLEEAFYSFTFGGELPAIAAALKTIQLLEEEEALQTLHRNGKLLRAGIQQAAHSAGLEALRSIGMDYFPGYAVSAVGEVSALEIQTLLQQELVRRGILTRSCLFVSSAHGPADIAATLDAFYGAATQVQAALKAGRVRESIEGQLIQPVFRALS